MMSRIFLLYIVRLIFNHINRVKIQESPGPYMLMIFKQKVLHLSDARHV